MSYLILAYQALLAFWLLRESRAQPRSPYYSYLQSLPQSYSNPYFCSPEERRLLPEYLSSKVEEQEKLVLRDYQKILKIEDVWSLREFSWAWFTVNTRAVYLEHDPRYESQSHLPSSDCLALVPYLDLLNHSGAVNVRPVVSRDSYSIVSLSPVGKYHQAFISYGPHDNTKLLIEYGFCLNDNPHESYNISMEDIIKFVESSEFECPDIDEKITMIRDRELDLKLCIIEEGFTWSLKTVLKLLSFQDGTYDCDSLLEKAYNEEDDEKYCSLYLTFLSFLWTRLTRERTKMKSILTECSGQFAQCYHLVDSHLRLLDRARSALTL